MVIMGITTAAAVAAASRTKHPNYGSFFCSLAFYLDEMQLARSARERQELPPREGVLHVAVVGVDKHLADLFSEFELFQSAHGLRQAGGMSKTKREKGGGGGGGGARPEQGQRM